MRPAFFVITSIVAVLIGVFAGMSLSQRQMQNEAGLTREDVSAIVESTLVEKPEILMRAAQAMQAKQQEQQQAQGRQAAAQLQELIFAETSPSTGELASSAVIAEFFDYQCGHCQTMYTRMKSFSQKHPNVRIVYKELPIFGGASVTAAQAALAAHKQGRYDEMHSALMELGEDRNVTEESIMDAARMLGLDIEQLKADMESEEVLRELDSNRQLAQSLGFRGTPAFVVRGPGTNGEPELIYGAVPLREMERLAVGSQ